MARTKVEIEVSTDTEIALMSRYGRKRELKTLVLNAIAEAVTLKTPWVKPAPKKRLAAQKTEQPIPPEVVDMVTRFAHGEKFVDIEGREVSALVVTEDQESCAAGLWLSAQFGGDDSEWFPISPTELKPTKSEAPNA